MTKFIVALVLAFALGHVACERDADAPPVAEREAIAWQPLGSWSGRGHLQTESFTSDTGALRIDWEATRADPGSVFQLTMHSAISGRPLEQIIDHQGAGTGTVYFYEDPRVFHAVVDSAGLDWRFTVAEGVTGRVAAEGR